MEVSYATEICDLCLSRRYSVLLELKSGRALRSDRRIVNGNLIKYLCDRCGLVRSGEGYSNETLREYYSGEYTLSEQRDEYFFHTPQGRVSRSQLFCEWLMSSPNELIWQEARRCLEVGAGSGLLLREISQRIPQAACEGLELNNKAVELARERGIVVHQGEPADLFGAQFDIIYSIAVLEHVASPTKFLSDLHRLLKPGGYLFLCQPTQDVASYDIFFLDHLHHFATEHLRRYANKTGFREQHAWVGHRWMPNFSLHCWQAVGSKENFVWNGPTISTKCAVTGRSVVSDMEHLNALMANLKSRQRRVAAFGLNEVYGLARAYSDFGNFRLVCGLDDEPNKKEYAALPFPVIKPEDCLALGVQNVVLTMNRVYYQYARQRLEKLGLETHPVLS